MSIHRLEEWEVHPTRQNSHRGHHSPSPLVHWKVLSEGAGKGFPERWEGRAVAVNLWTLLLLLDLNQVDRSRYYLGGHLLLLFLVSFRKRP